MAKRHDDEDYVSAEARLIHEVRLLGDIVLHFGISMTFGCGGTQPHKVANADRLLIGRSDHAR